MIEIVIVLQRDSLNTTAKLCVWDPQERTKYIPIYNHFRAKLYNHSCSSKMSRYSFHIYSHVDNFSLSHSRTPNTWKLVVTPLFRKRQFSQCRLSNFCNYFVHLLNTCQDDFTLILGEEGIQIGCRFLWNITMPIKHLVYLQVKRYCY